MIFITGIPRPPGFFRATGTVDSTAILDGSVAKVDLDADAFDDLDAAVVDVAADSVIIIDADDGGNSKKEAVADVATAMAGEGLIATSGVLSVDLDEFGDATIDVAADTLIFIDEATAGDPGKLESVADFITAVAGTTASTGLAASSGVLSVSPTDVSIDVSADSILFKDATDSTVHIEAAADLAAAMAGEGLAATTGALSVDLDEFGDEVLDVAADTLIFIDESAAGDPGKLESVVDFVAAIAGDGLTATSGVIAVDLNELTEAVVNVGVDYVPFIDADGNVSRKEAVADIATAMAGAGLTATSGVIDMDVNTDWQMIVPLIGGVANGGTWTPTVTSSVFTVVRTAANATEYWYVPIIVPNRTTANKGVKLTSVDVAYSLVGSNTTDDDLEIHILKNTVGTDGNATAGVVLAGDDDADYDEAHNTKAERLDPTGSPELHTATVTIPVGEQAYATDNETYWLGVKVKDNAGADLTLILTGAVANFTEALG